MRCTSFLKNFASYFILGIIVGTGSIIYSQGLWAEFEIKDYLDILGGALMFLVACIAGWINYEHLQWQKQSRTWEASKNFFFELLDLLDKSENYYSVLEHNTLVNHGAYIDPNQQLQPIPDDAFLKDFNLKLKQLKSIYSCFLPNNLRDEIESYFKKESEIEINYDEGMYGEIDLIHEIFKSNDVLKDGILNICKNFLVADNR